MAVEGGMKCVKFLLFFFNFVFWLCGLALIVLGVLVQVALHKTLVIQGAAGSAAPIVLIAVGVVIFIVGFFGCCGAYKESQCMIAMFILFLVLIIIVEIGAAIAGYVLREKLTDLVEHNLKNMIKQYNTSTEIRKALDDLQEELKCCGAQNSTDWAAFKPDTNSVPDSCCLTVTTDCGQGAIGDSSRIHVGGCGGAVEQLLRNNVLWIIVGAIVIAVIQVMGIVLACLLRRAIRSGYEVM